MTGIQADGNILVSLNSRPTQSQPLGLSSILFIELK
jgi:hypothetical protein